MGYSRQRLVAKVVPMFRFVNTPLPNLYHSRGHDRPSSVSRASSVTTSDSTAAGFGASSQS